MKTPSILLVFSLAFLIPTFAQSPSSQTSELAILDKLGPHQNGGRGCISCHAPHTAPVSFDLWSPDLGPVYARNTLPDEAALDSVALPTPSEDLDSVFSSIMICLSCHDGNIAVGAMMTNQAYQPTLAGIPSGYGENAIPIFPGYERVYSTRHLYLDHPIGPQANLRAVGVANRLVLTRCGANATPCLQPNIADPDFMSFYENYGAFNITQKDVENRFYSGGRTSGVIIPEGATDPGSAYVVCMTCHMPHTMRDYSGNVRNSPKADVYSTYWFVAAPYNPDAFVASEWKASSATQFCRQCHFNGPGGANESSGIFTIQTQF